MIRQLQLRNFRIFDDEVTIRIRPITLLIGKNNAGKSSVIRFLLMLQQSTGLNSKAFLDSRGEKVDLGKFYELKNSASRKRYLHFALHVQQEGSPRDPLGIYLREKGFNYHEHPPQYLVTADVLYNPRNLFQGKDWKFTLSSANQAILQRSMPITENSRFLQPATGHPVEYSDSNAAVTRESKAEQCCLESIAQTIGTMAHIGPSRNEMPRSIDIGENVPSHHVGRNGEYALHHLWRLLKESRDRAELIGSHLKKIVDIRDIAFSEKGDLALCETQNAKTGARTNIANFGFGTSQCLPILIQGGIMNPGTTLLVEQPETQIHPTAQLELGSFFFDLWKQRKVSSIIETHSGNTLLRLQRLIARGDLSAEDVSVVFFDVENQKSVVNNLEIKEDGSLGDGLPMEFFHQDIWEAMDLEVGE
ncbi:MAG: AAA family ATPase [Gammaproteobacteria bacterium]|nr:AAA family ATPase [Gammaproteobacteria bacterium]